MQDTTRDFSRTSTGDAKAHSNFFCNGSAYRSKTGARLSRPYRLDPRMRASWSSLVFEVPFGSRYSSVRGDGVAGSSWSPTGAAKLKASLRSVGGWAGGACADRVCVKVGGLFSRSLRRALRCDKSITEFWRTSGSRSPFVSGFARTENSAWSLRFFSCSPWCLFSRSLRA